MKDNQKQRQQDSYQRRQHAEKKAELVKGEFVIPIKRIFMDCTQTARMQESAATRNTMKHTAIRMPLTMAIFEVSVTGRHGLLRMARDLATEASGEKKAFCRVGAFQAVIGRKCRYLFRTERRLMLQ